MHKEYRRIVEHSDLAILFIHGIVGTPNHFRFLMPLVPEDISVVNVLLDGHGKGVKDFSGTSMKKWEQQITDVVNELAQAHGQIWIVAHSLGCLLAIEQAVNNPKITKLLLLAAPLKVSLRPRMFVNTLSVYLDRIDPNNEERVAAKASYSIAGDKNLLHYIGWIPRYLELLAKIRKTRRIIDFVKIPCVAIQSFRDEMVSNRSRAILEKNPAISIVELENSGHYYYPKQDISRIKQIFVEFIS